MPQALGVSAEPLRQGKQVRKLKKQIEFWMSRTPADLSRMRTARMKSMLNEGGAQSYRIAPVFANFMSVWSLMG